MTLKLRATIEDLYLEPGKAELVDGEIVRMAATGAGPGYAGDAIFASLWEHARRTGRGRAIGDNKGFRVRLPRRESFSPDVGFLASPGKLTMKFYEGAPTFAVEVRSEGDYGSAADERIEAKRRDYFLAGTQVIWDVDILSADVIRVYRAATPNIPTIYRRGDVAEAEPAVQGWTMPVAQLFI